VALVPWLWPRWRAALRQRDTFVAVLLAWVVIVVTFFSASSGKRGLYILPAVPALAMAAAPWLPELLRARGPRRLAFGLAVALVAVAALGAGYFALSAHAAEKMLRTYGLHPVLPFLVVAAAGILPIAWLRLRDGWLAYAGVLTVLVLTVGLVVYPRMDAERSGRAFMDKVEAASVGVQELGLVSAKEQYLLQLRRPSVNFGHARWREREVEAADAAAWLAERPGRALLVEHRTREICFAQTDAVELGRANRARWSLVSGTPDPDCVARGDASRAIPYVPPAKHLDTGS
jgi:4-amino-4-deoxy-L-arabinose transferase-like glycosyltransferase